MARIRRWGAAAALLLLFGSSAPACQLSLSGPVIQKPLTYNPFQAGASMAELSFTVRNGDAKPCEAAFAFFRRGAPLAVDDGAALKYQLSAQPGPVTQNAETPPITLRGGGAMASLTVGARQTSTAHAMISVGDGQVVGPGIYRDQLTLGFYQSEPGRAYTRIAEAPVAITIRVNSQMTLAVAGGGRKTTLNFGDFVEGAVRSVLLLAYSNQSFHLAVSSDNAGVMKPIDASPTEGWRVPYTISVDRGRPLDLSRDQIISLGQRGTSKFGLSIPIDVRVGSMKNQRAGYYRDVVTVAIDPGL